MKENYKRLTTEIPVDLHKKAKYESYKQGKTLTMVVIELLEQWLKG